MLNALYAAYSIVLVALFDVLFDLGNTQSN